MENFKHFIGKFVDSELQVAAKLKNAKAFIFDWDGVFNNGFKQGQIVNGPGEMADADYMAAAVMVL